MVCKKAEIFSTECVDAILRLDFESCVNLQSLIVTVIGVYTSMRIKDMHGILARHVTQVEHTPDAPRHFKIIMTATKNDMEGTSATV